MTLKVPDNRYDRLPSDSWASCYFSCLVWLGRLNCCHFGV